MSLVTIIWSMVASACLTLAAMHLLVWFRKRTEWASLLFSLAAAATAAVAYCELRMMRADTPEQFGAAVRWLHVPIWIIFMAIVGFVRFRLRAGRAWLAWSVCALRTLSLLPNFLAGQNLNYRETTALQHIRFLGEPVSVAEGVSNPWMLVGQLSSLLLVAFAVDAAITVWRRGDKRQAMITGGAIVFFALAGTIGAILISWQIVHIPVTLSFYYMGLIAVVAYEMSTEVLQAARLSADLREREESLRLSQARVSSAIDIAGLGFYESGENGRLAFMDDRVRALLGLPPEEEPRGREYWLAHIHPEDLPQVLQVSTAVLGGHLNSYAMEYRYVHPSRGILWFRHLSRVLERDTAGRSLRTVGVVWDITEHKHNERMLLDSRETLRTFASRLLTIQDEERRRLARELHDDFTQRLAVLAMEISTIETSAGSAKANPLPALKRIREQIVKLSSDIHDISRQLHPSIIDDLGLKRAIQSECANFTRRTGIAVSCESTSIPSTIPRDVAVGLFRIAQEALRNVQKHAHVKEADVLLTGSDDSIALTIHDSGTGFDPATVRQSHGLGLFSMEERAQLIQGAFSLDSAPGQGTRVQVVVPLKGIEHG